VGELFITGKEPPGQRMAYWLETVCSQILPVQIDPRHDRVPDAGMSCNALGALRIRDVVGGDHVYTRTDRLVRRGDPQTVQIGMPLKGCSLLVQDGREAVLSPGDMVVYDSSRPFTLVMESNFRWQVFLLPKVKLQRSDRELAQLTAIAIRPSESMSRVVARFMRGLTAEASYLEHDTGAAALGENAADLIVTLVRSRFGKQWAVGDRDWVLIHAIQSFIADNHGCRDLDPQMIAAAHGISTRRLHALLGPTGRSVGDRVRDERLAAIRRDLADPRLAHRSIGRIAAWHGMPNASAFARLFKTVEGSTAREYRANALRMG